jgi:hypothetical protein
MLIEKNNNIINKLVPTAILLTIITVLSRFFAEPFRFTIQADDFLFLNHLKNKSVWDTSIAILHSSNGRWFSHFYTALVFSILKTNWSIYFIYDIFAFLLLVFSLFCFFNSFIKREIISRLTFTKKLLLSFFTACMFFIFLIDGRYEVFYWVSSISNHLLSIIFFFFTLSLFIGKSFWRFPLLAVLAFCLGQMNEIYVMNYLLILFFLQLALPETRISFIVFLIVIGGSFLFNITSAGASARLNEAAPDFNTTQTMRNAGETFLLPIINYKYLPIKITSLILLIFSLRNYFKLKFSLESTYFYTFNRLLFLACIFGICVQCFLLKMVCPYRSMLAYCLGLIYFIFLMACKGIANPIRLFFK